MIASKLWVGNGRFKYIYNLLLANFECDRFNHLFVTEAAMLHQYA